MIIIFFFKNIVKNTLENPGKEFHFTVGHPAIATAKYGGPSVSLCFHCSFQLVIQKSNSFPLLKLEFNSVFIFNLKLILKLISNQY